MTFLSHLCCLQATLQSRAVLDTVGCDVDLALLRSMWPPGRAPSPAPLTVVGSKTRHTFDRQNGASAYTIICSSDADHQAMCLVSLERQGVSFPLIRSCWNHELSSCRNDCRARSSSCRPGIKILSFGKHRWTTAFQGQFISSMLPL